MQWYERWKSSPSNLEATIAERPAGVICVKSLLKSRALQANSRRQRAPGAGRAFAAPMVREALYEWWSSIRYAIDWKQLVAENRSRG